MSSALRNEHADCFFELYLNFYDVASLKQAMRKAKLNNVEDKTNSVLGRMTVWFSQTAWNFLR